MILLVVAVFALIVLVVLEFFDRRGRRVYAKSDAQGIKRYMHEWIEHGGRVAIWTRDMSWAQNPDTQQLLTEKARRNELILCLPAVNGLAADLAKAGAEVCAYGATLLESLASRFTIAFFGRDGSRIAVGRADGPPQGAEHPAERAGTAPAAPGVAGVRRRRRGTRPAWALALPQGSCAARGRPRRRAGGPPTASTARLWGAEDGQPKHGGILRVRGFDPPHFGDLKQPESAIGTGPFILERYEPNVKTVFTRNPTYFRPGQPHVDRVEWVVIDDASTGLAMYRAGQLNCGPMEWWVVRQPDLEALQKSHPHLRYKVASPAGV